MKPSAFVRARFARVFALLCALGAFAAFPAGAQPADKPVAKASFRDLYTKSEFYITMRDGIRLYTVVFYPKDTSKTYPILLERTPYGIPYGKNTFPNDIEPSMQLVRSGYIFAHQDVRGTHLSEGQFVNVRPILPAKHGPRDIDEATDAYDTIDYLVGHSPRNNGRVGMWGISYPGFYADCGAICGHPALVAVSPQAPLTDWFTGDDEHHNGAFYLMDDFDWEWTFDFDYPRKALTQGYPQPHHEFPTHDAYQFYLDMGPLPNANDKYLKNTVPYWNELMDHPDDDAYWQSRDLNPHLVNVKPALLVTGGLFDCEDFYGTLATYRNVGRQSPQTTRFLALGPWEHGGWNGDDGRTFGGLDFGSDTAEHYRENIEYPFFEHYLKGVGPTPTATVQVFDTGANQWRTFPSWPPRDVQPRALYLAPDHALAFAATGGDAVADTYTSDPAHPVPYSAHAHTQSDRFTPYMAENQRFVDARPDVLTYRSEPLTYDIFAAGPVPVDLSVSTTGTDADFVVKIIDVYPATATGPDAKLANSEILVRADVMRGRFRDSLVKPTPFAPGRVTPVHFTLPDICHTFRKGHRIEVQIQSSWFPIIDRNPQTFVDIYKANADDFKKADVSVWRGGADGSRVTLRTVAGVDYE